MAKSCILYYITDRTAFPGDDRTRRHHLLDNITEAASAGIDYIQLREKDLPTRHLESLAREAMRIIGQEKSATDHCPLTTALLINSRTDIALAAKAAGVHLRSSDISPQEVRLAWRGAGAPARELSPQNPLIVLSCHSQEEVEKAAANQATFAVFAPVFEKNNSPASNPAGLEALHQACRAKIPILALGGITMQNAELCLEAGAAGIAAIRLFQENDIATIVRKLRH